MSDSSQPALYSDAMQVSPARIAAMSDADLGNLVLALIKAEAYKCGLPANQIIVNTEEALAGEFTVGGVAIQPNLVSTDEQNYWNMLKLLSFNMSQLLTVENAKESLKGFLRLFINTNATHHELNVIYDVTAKKINSPFLLEGRMVFVPGMKIEITLDNSELNADYSLFIELLNDFFLAQTAFDRCCQLVVSYTSFNWPTKVFDAQLGERVCS